MCYGTRSLHEVAAIEKVKIKEKIKEEKPYTNAVKEISLAEVKDYMNEDVKLCGKVYGEKIFSNMILLDIGATYPNQLLTVVLKDSAKENWAHQIGASLCFTGKIIDYRGKPEIVISDLSNFDHQKN
jgi:hypothetical protein